MWKYTVEVKGMMCGMCEAHMNDAIRRDFKVKKVKSSHTKNQVVIVSEDDITEEALLKTVKGTGYEMGSMHKENYVKKGIFGF